MATANRIDLLIGNTPLVELTRIEAREKLQAKLFAKIESMNPGGSVKDRVAKAILDDAENYGRLKPGGTVIEPTSGNTGIGLALVCASRGYRLIVVMPDSMSVERRKLIAAYGAKLVLTEGARGMRGAIEKADELHKEIENSVIAGQFTNPANPKAHYLSTGPEIWADTDGGVDLFVAGVGTGGTVTGVGRYLKEQKPQVKIVAVEPIESAVLSGKPAGKHLIQGIGAGFVPEVLDKSVLDEILPVSGADAIDTARTLAKTEGILAGVSSGAALFAAITLARRAENKNKTIVTLLPDTGDRYLSTELYSE